MASSVAGGCFCLKVGKKEASVWDGLCDQKPSLTFGYSSMSPCGCHLGLLACILPTSGCQSLLVPYSRTKTSAVPPCCLSTSLSTCWQCLHTQPVVLIWELQFVRLSTCGVFLLTGVHLLVGTSHECVHTSACGASPLYSSAFVHLCFSIRLSLPLRVTQS